MLVFSADLDPYVSNLTYCSARQIELVASITPLVSARWVNDQLGDSARLVIQKDSPTVSVSALVSLPSVFIEVYIAAFDLVPRPIALRCKMVPPLLCGGRCATRQGDLLCERGTAISIGDFSRRRRRGPGLCVTRAPDPGSDGPVLPSRASVIFLLSSGSAAYKNCNLLNLIF